MAARNYASNRTYNWHLFPVHLDAQVTIGSSGAPTLVSSTTVPGSSPAASQKESRGIKSITRLATGTYRIQFDDNYSDMYDFKASFTSAVTGSEIAVDATTAGLSVGTAYQITTVGTATTDANWTTLGLPTGMTAALGMVFVALTTGTGIQSGAGKVKALANQTTGFQAQVIGDPRTMLNAQPFQQGSGGGYLTFQTMGATFTAGAYTPAGTNSVPVFTGTIGGLVHNHLVTVDAGTAGDAVTNNAGVLNSVGGQDLATTSNGAGTPSGTINAPIFTGNAATLTGTVTSAAADPTNGCTMYIRILLSNSSIQ